MGTQSLGHGHALQKTSHRWQALQKPSLHWQEIPNQLPLDGASVAMATPKSKTARWIFNHEVNCWEVFHVKVLTGEFAGLGCWERLQARWVGVWVCGCEWECGPSSKRSKNGKHKGFQVYSIVGTFQEIIVTLKNVFNTARPILFQAECSHRYFSFPCKF